MNTNDNGLSKQPGTPRHNAFSIVISVVVVLYIAYKFGHEAGVVFRSIMEMLG